MQEVDHVLAADAKAAADAVCGKRAEEPKARQGEAFIQGVGVAGEVVTDVMSGLSRLWGRATGGN